MRIKEILIGCICLVLVIKLGLEIHSDCEMKKKLMFDAEISKLEREIDAYVLKIKRLENEKSYWKNSYDNALDDLISCENN